jgi:hypothetical protein
MPAKSMSLVSTGRTSHLAGQIRVARREVSVHSCHSPVGKCGRFTSAVAADERKFEQKLSNR